LNERQVIPNPRGSRRGRTSRIPVCIESLMRVLLLNLGVDSLQAANSALASQGYDVARNTCREREPSNFRQSPEAVLIDFQRLNLRFQR
jgi:hypothetical protein